VDGINHGARHDLGDGICKLVVAEHHEHCIVDVCLGACHRLVDLQSPRDVPGLSTTIDVRKVLAADGLDPSVCVCIYIFECQILCISSFKKT
jgi:hypothetical protein